MAMGFKGLENKLKGVQVGAFLKLTTESGDGVAGYVKKVSRRKVKLSHESPFNKKRPYTNQYFLIPKIRDRIGDREYKLRDFAEYTTEDYGVPFSFHFMP